IPANLGYVAAARHFPQSAMMMPDVVLIEADHDMRNSADLLVLNKLAKAILTVPGVAKVQSITRPKGTQIDHTSLPYMLSMQNAPLQQIVPFQKARMDDMLVQADEMAKTIGILQRIYSLMQEMYTATHHMVGETHDLQALTDELRDHIADFEDFW